MEILSQEFIYRSLQNREYLNVITTLFERGNSLDKDPSVALAIDIFMDEFFRTVLDADLQNRDELSQDLDILYLSHITEDKYKLKEGHAITLIGLLRDRAPLDQLFKGAQEYPHDPICKEIIEAALERQNRISEALIKPYRPTPLANIPKSAGKKFEVKIAGKDGNSWVKVYLRSVELVDSLARHLRKLSSIGRVNITVQDSGHHDLTVYSRSPFTIEETAEEVTLTLENYFSRSPQDPVFKKEVLSGLSDVAYFEILDYMIKLGSNLEGFRSLATKMDEERYRDYLVNYLDSLSEDHHATAETFRGSGKTDILVRNGKKEALLIAECKLWAGKGYLTKALNQLFERYVLWKDRKAAILIFNTKMKDFGKLIESAIDVLKMHPLFVTYIGKREETSHSFIFRNHNDVQQMVQLELVIFNFA
ncbi:hypothetical protein [Pedobacter agri]|uniref:hypothetical protein n=1 Tax=Pedobacter agri TaxID=454586 RepID=UPI002931BB12|nr:hypothetical protein [Pedobacter agri]